MKAITNSDYLHCDTKVAASSLVINITLSLS
jgi:hypothetical protein